MKKFISVILVLVFVLGAVSFASAAERLMVYTSMKESLIGKLRDAFAKKYPGIAFDYYSAGAGKLMAKIAAERQSGKMTVDVLWHSEVPDFYQLKKEGIFRFVRLPGSQVCEEHGEGSRGLLHPGAAWDPRHRL